MKAAVGNQQSAISIQQSAVSNLQPEAIWRRRHSHIKFLVRNYVCTNENRVPYCGTKDHSPALQSLCECWVLRLYVGRDGPSSSEVIHRLTYSLPKL